MQPIGAASDPLETATEISMLNSKELNSANNHKLREDFELQEGTYQTP